VIATRLLRTVLIAPVLLAAAATAACDDSPLTPAPAFMQTDLRAGTGTAAANGNVLTVQYTGWIYDDSKADQKGLQFESNVGGTAFQFQLGSGQVIAGWDQGLVGIQPGGIRRLVIPPAMAYGGVRRGPIPPNATLIFEIEVTAIEAAGTQ
jgi:FKBP-type peptidyl-prolyl cis-trans isomerase FkpA